MGDVAGTRRKKQIVRWVKETNPCQNCYETEPVCLDLHHIDPRKKSDEIAKMIIQTGVTVDALVWELKKCAILCANCHRKFHAEKLPDYVPWPVVLGHYVLTGEEDKPEWLERRK